jgi:hypothetical protein
MLLSVEPLSDARTKLGERRVPWRTIAEQSVGWVGENNSRGGRGRQGGFFIVRLGKRA